MNIKFLTRVGCQDHMDLESRLLTDGETSDSPNVCLLGYHVFEWANMEYLVFNDHN